MVALQRLVDAAQMRALDEHTIRALGVPGLVLMESAGRGVVQALWALAPDLRRGQVVVVAGPGNNGADGLVVARYLHNAGVAVRAVLCAAAERLRGDAAAQLAMARACGVMIVEAAEATAAVTEALRALGRGDVVVDALLGTGLSRPASGDLAAVIAAINACPALRVAVDIPSGLSADGAALGEDAAVVQAQHTVTFGWAKLGLCSAPGHRAAGRVSVVDIGIPAALAPRLGVRSWLLGPQVLQPLWTPRDSAGHKGSHGHLLIIAGSEGKTGAALLAMHGAQAAGVGLCTVAAPPGAQEALQARVLEAMTLRYPAPEAGAEALERAWLAAAAGKRALAIGPGLPGGPAVAQALRRLLEAGDAPVVLDAEALNLLADKDGLATLRAVTARGRALVLTPHPGEAARLLGVTGAAVQADRLMAARRLCRETGAVVLLKGERTVVAVPAAPSNADRAGAEGEALFLCPTGNAGMGCGGMGDVLTGMIGALLASGLPTPALADAALTPAAFAACAAAYWHGLAGDCLLRRRFPAALLLAGELCQALPEALREAQSLHQAPSRQTASVAADALHHPLQPEADARS